MVHILRYHWKLGLSPSHGAVVPWYKTSAVFGASTGEIMAETHALRLQARERKTEQVKVSDPWDEMTSPSEKTTRGPRNEGTKPEFLWSF